MFDSYWVNTVCAESSCCSMETGRVTILFCATKPGSACNKCLPVSLKARQFYLQATFPRIKVLYRDIENSAKTNRNTFESRKHSLKQFPSKIKEGNITNRLDRSLLNN